MGMELEHVGRGPPRSPGKAQGMVRPVMPCQVSSDEVDRITAGSVILCSVLGSRYSDTCPGHTHWARSRPHNNRHACLQQCLWDMGTCPGLCPFQLYLSTVAETSPHPNLCPGSGTHSNAGFRSCASCLLGTSPQPCQVVLLLAPLLKELVTGWLCPGLQCTLGQRGVRDWDWLLPA